LQAGADTAYGPQFRERGQTIPGRAGPAIGLAVPKLAGLASSVATTGAVLPHARDRAR
jgi:hypothetical protein